MFPLISRVITGHPRVYDFLNSRRPIRDPLEKFLAKLPGRLTFVQVGASDGLRWDPLRRFVIKNCWSGVFVEPIPHVFTMLTENYRYLSDNKSYNLRFLDVAVTAETSKKLEFWSFSDDFLRRLPVDSQMYYLRKASFQKRQVISVISSHELDPTVLKRLKIRTLTINELLKWSFPDKTPDLLMIDTEGYDGEIIRSLDFSRYSPLYIVFEAHSIDSDSVTDLLETNGYRTERLGGDFAASLQVR